MELDLVEVRLEVVVEEERAVEDVVPGVGEEGVDR